MDNGFVDNGNSTAEEEQDIPTLEKTNDTGDEDMVNFWNAQPLPELVAEDKMIEEGPLKIQRIEDVSQDTTELPDGIEWCTLDPTNDEELNDLWELLNGQYVEDDDAVFRFDYSKNMLRWALAAPGWKSSWHLGIRSSASHKLLAFISALPKLLRVRVNILPVFEFNFLCIDRVLRGKRLTPALITEITRRCNLEGLWNALHTGGVKLPRPVSVCRYFHRPLNWKTLCEVGFSSADNVEIEVAKYSISDETSMAGLREMDEKDVDQVQQLWTRYSKRFEIAPQFSKEEIRHWLVPNKVEVGGRTIWAYVVEDEKEKITDFFSFYCVDHTVLDSTIQIKSFRVGYLFYYATEVRVQETFDKTALQARLNILMADAVILAKRAKLDVLNAMSIMDNALFLDEQKFVTGDGQLYYYISNYNVNPVSGGMGNDNELDMDLLSGVGLTMI